MRRGPAVAVLLLALALAASCSLAGAEDSNVERRKRRDKHPWFCHGRDCPGFKTLREEGSYSLRRYDRSTWAISCAFDAFMPDAVLRTAAHVLRYVKDNDLWGATPFAHFVHISVENQAAWNASAALMAGSGATAGDTDTAPTMTAAGAAAAAAAAAPPGNATLAGPGLECIHKTVCTAYFLPNKYQGTAARDEVDRRPPRPGRDSCVKIIRAPRFEAYVTGYPGFPSPGRFVWSSMRLAHELRWHGEPFYWGTAMMFVYDPPTATTGRWNEVLIPRRHMHELLLAEGRDVFSDSVE